MKDLEGNLLSSAGEAGDGLVQWSSTFLAPGNGFANEFFHGLWVGEGRWFQDDPNALHLLCTLLLLHHLHLKSSGIRSRRLGTPGLVNLKS